MKRELHGKFIKKIGILSIIILLISMLLVQPIFCTSIEAENIEYYNNLNINSNYNEILDYYNKDNGKDNEDSEIAEYLNYTDEYIEYLKLSDEEKSKVHIIPRKYYVPLDMIYEDTIEVKEKPSLFNLFGLFADTTLQKTYGSSLPDKFDLRDKINIKVEHQGSYGNCWNFSSMTSLETNLALKGYGDYDFSELHMDYLTSKEVDPSMTRTLNVTGGHFSTFADYVSMLKGPVLETEVPYNKTYDKSQYSYLQSLEPKAYVLETVDFPTIHKLEGKPLSEVNYMFASNVDYELSDKEMELYRDTVKNHIMNNGSLFTALGWGPCNENGGYTTYYTTGNYFYGNPLEGHGVSIIGWDDNFPKEYFEEVTSDGTFKPSKDGAYIAVNSWGKDWGNNGVFYISYEDADVERELSGVVKATNKSEDVTKKTVNFEDENLYNFLKQELKHKIYSYDDATKSIVFTEYAISNVNELNLVRSNASNLSGLENFWNLTHLSVYEMGGSNASKNSSVLSSLTNLEVLNLGNISNIECLKNLTNLEYLDLSNNNINDFTPLNNLSNLKVLDVSKTNISDLECIENLEQLRILKIDNNNISNFEGLSDLINLQKLYIESTNMVDADCLKNLTKLEELTLGDSTLKDLDKLSELVNLKKLILTHNCDLENIDFLKTLTSLEELQIEYTNINDFSAIGNLSNLGILVIDKTNMTSTSCLKELKNLCLVTLMDNKITDCSGFDNFGKPVDPKYPYIYVNISGNNITDISSIPKNLEGITFSLEKNSIFDFPDDWDFATIKTKFKLRSQSMTVYHDISTGNKLPLPDMFSYVYNNISDKTKIKSENCTIDYANKEIIIDTSKGNTGVATVTLEGFHTISNNSFGDSVYTINFAEGPMLNITTTYNTIELSNKEIITDLNSLNNLSSEVLTYEHFPNNGCDMKAYDSDGNEISSTDKFPTGSRIEITAPNGMSKTYYVFVKGDVDQNGTVDLYDILKLIELVFDNDSTYVWDEFVRLAGKCADGSLTGNPNLYDIMRLIEFQFDNKGW